MDRSVSTRPLVPEVGQLDSRRAERLRRLGNLLDNSIPVPGTRFRFGLDTVIGLVPGVGDLVGGALSVYIILEAARLGVPRPLLARMGYNVAVDTVVGGVPLLGDLFDAGFKANLRNLALVREHLERPAAVRQSGRRFAIVLAVGIFLLIAAAAAAGVLLVQLLSRPVL
ncbi:MAG: DUF4112 domain-containing protein [Gemmatimonadales bacterium]|nr:DUF4112 domain-containing protein [Gemmatimonadales bacterium]MBA3555677.1 DUF4112 domain-containing protein [Gemmatimonadales bacterium]